MDPPPGPVSGSDEGSRTRAAAISVLGAASDPVNGNNSVSRSILDDDEARESTMPDIDRFSKSIFGYDYEPTEQEFIQHIDPSVRWIFLLLYGVVGLAIIAAQLTTPTTPYAAMAIQLVFCFILQLILFTVQKCGPKRMLPTAVAIQRLGVQFSWAFSSFAAMWNFYETLASCGDGNLVAVNSPAYIEANCTNRIPSHVVANIVTLVLLRTMRLKVVVGISVLNLLMMIALYIPYSDRLETSVLISWAFFVIVVAAFLCIVRHDQESEQRAQFEQRLTLEERLEDLRLRKRELLDFCKGFIPEALLRTSNRGLACRTIPDAAVAVIGVHDFGVVCSKFLPMQVAAFVSSLHGLCSKNCETMHIHRALILGDEYTAIGNVLKRERHAVGCAVRFAHNTMNSGEFKLGLSAGIGVGPLTAGFVGDRYVRYDIVGPALSDARRARLLATEKGIVVTDMVAHALQQSATVSELDGRDAEDSRNFFKLVALDETEETLPAANTSTSVTDSSLTDPFGGSLRDGSTTSMSASGGGNSSETSSNGKRSFFSRMKRFALPSSTGDSAGGGDTENSAATSAAGENNPLQIAITAADERALESDDEQAAAQFSELILRIETVCCCLQQYEEEETEELFMKSRGGNLANRAERVWIAYGAVVVSLLFIRIADHTEAAAYPAGMSEILLALAVLLSIFVAVFPRIAASEFIPKYHTGWSLLGIAIPVLVIYGCAVSRPAIIGNDIEGLLLLATMVRYYSFKSFRWQLFVTPVMLIISSLQFALEGALMRATIIFTYLIILWTLAVDQEREAFERRYFETSQKMEEIINALEEQRRIRLGLLKCMLPAPLYVTVSKNMMQKESTLIKQLHETTVILAKAVSYKITSDNAATHFYKLESFVDQVPGLELVSLSGDTALIAGPLMLNQGTIEPPEEVLVNGVELARRLAEHGEYKVLLEYDSCIQVLKLGAFPSFTLLGAGTTRALSISAAGGMDSVVGAVVTEKAAHSYSGAMDRLQIGDDDPIRSHVSTTSEKPLRLRGVGLVRFHKLLLGKA